jgi:hypothetical protein
MYKRTRFVLIFAALTISTAVWAQSDQCSQGVIKNPGQANGVIEICPPLAAQAPALASQLNDITKSLGAQKEELNEIRRLIKSLNSVSQNIGAQRQGELLRNLSSQLAMSQQGGKAKTAEQISALADGFDGVEDKLVGMLTDKTTSAKTSAAVDGPVGDAIAKLDFTSAQSQLDDIRQQLKAIHAEVGQVNQTTKETNERTKDIQKTVEQTRADEQQYLKTNAEQSQQAMEQMKKLREQQQNNPATFANVHIFVRRELSRAQNRTAVPGNWIIQAGVTAAQLTQPLQDAKLEIAFRSAGKKDWDVASPVRPIFSHETFGLETQELGQQAVVCFTARDPQRGQRIRWRQSFTIEPDNTHALPTIPGVGPMLMNFVPAAAATLTPVTNEPCQ